MSIDHQNTLVYRPWMTSPKSVTGSIVDCGYSTPHAVAVRTNSRTRDPARARARRRFMKRLN
jgi:hypothetical protein